MMGRRVAQPDSWSETNRMRLHQGVQGFPEAKGNVVLADLIPNDSLMRSPEALKSVIPGTPEQDAVWSPARMTCRKSPAGREMVEPAEGAVVGTGTGFPTAELCRACDMTAERPTLRVCKWRDRIWWRSLQSMLPCGWRTQGQSPQKRFQDLHVGGGSVEDTRRVH